MTKFKVSIKAWLSIVLGVVAVLLMAGQVRAAVNVIDNTGSSIAGDSASNPINNKYTSTTGMTMKTGTTSSGTALSNESGISLSFNNANLTTQYNADAAYNSTNNLESGSGTGSKLNITGNNVMTNGNAPYNGGYIKVSGTLGLTVNLSSSLSIKEVEAGNYGAMVRVTLPKDVDASQLQDAIQWDKAYFSLTLTPLGGSFGSPSFPMQFDHHVYLDPTNKNAFYLKVKGVPIQSVVNGSTAYMKMMRLQDQTDLKNNITSSGTSIKPTELATSATGVSNSTTGAGILVPGGTGYGFNLLYNPSSQPGLFNYGSAMQAQGDIGWSYALVNNFKALGLSGINGTANINFYVDVSKYSGNISDHSPNKQLTAGKLPPSPRPDGLFDMKIGVYGTSQLRNPFSSSADRTVAGRTPMEYALIDSSQVNSPQAGGVTSNMTSWNAYASPWDTKKSLNTATSAWESVVGDKTRFKNVSLDDTLTDRTVTLDTLTDGIMTAKATDYSGTKAPTLGAVGSNRFARAVNYFDTSTVDSNGEGTVATDKKVANATLAAKAYTAATAGVASPNSDPSLTALPSLTTNTTNKNYLYYTGTTTSSAGTAIPILPAPLFFNQKNTPPVPTVNWDTSNPYIIKKSQLINGKTVTLTGTWTDNYANNDTLTTVDDKNGGKTTSTVNASDAKTLNVKVTSGSVSGALNLGSDSTVVGAHKLTVTINRPTIKLADGTTIASNATANATLNVNVVDDTVKYDITANKYISNNGNKLTQQTVHGPTAGNNQTGDTVTMVDEFTNNDRTITNPIVVATLPSQLKNVGNVTATINGTSVTPTVTTANGLTYITLGKQIVKGDKVVVTYQVQTTAAMPTNGVSLTDVLMDQSTYAAETNAVTLLPAPDGGIEITPPTDLEFGEHPATPGVYKNTDGDKTLLVVDNRATPGPWTVTAQLSDFKNADGTRKLTGETAKIAFGTPALSSAVFTAGGTANKLVSYDFASKQTTMAYTFKNIQLQLAGTSIQPGDYNATITYSWTDGVN